MQEDYFNRLDNFLAFVKRRRHQFAIFKTFLGFGFSVFLVFLILNLPAFFIRTNYAFKKPKFSSSKTYSGQTTSTSSHDLATPQDPGPDRIEIEKIGVSAPIIWGSTAETINSDLEKGVVQIRGTAKPDEQGNILITGHSSDFWWRKGDFKTVFVLLDKLSSGDQIKLVYNGRVFNFEIIHQQVIKPEQIDEVLALQTQRNLVLMTCVPIGTAWKRLLIFAQPV